MADQYVSMTKLYEDPANVEGTTYDKRWSAMNGFNSWNLKLRIA
jgi:hypothetical protein